MPLSLSPPGVRRMVFLSRRSTDRISTSRLANFAQLSMFRFDGSTIAKAIIVVNRQNDNNHYQSDSYVIGKAIFNEIYLRGMLIFLEDDAYGA